MESLPINVPPIVQELLRRAGLSQYVLARQAGLTQQALSQYMHGKRSPTLEVLQRIAAGAGFQLRLSLEPLASDVMRDLDQVQRQSVEEWLAELGLIWTGAQTLVRGVRHRFEGLVAARLNGVPVTDCSVVEVAVPADDATLTTIVHNAPGCMAELRVPGSEWASPPGDLDVLRDRLDDGVLHWHPYRVPEVQMRLSSDVGATTRIALTEQDAAPIAVAPISEIVVSDSRVARALQLIRESS
jgi:transcriptional regulator with XRE-family HTH domain